MVGRRAFPGERCGQRQAGSKGTARTISWRDQAPIVTDGPFIEAKESIAGFLIVDVEDETAAIELASTWLAKVGFKIEVRAIQGSPGE